MEIRKKTSQTHPRPARVPLFLLFAAAACVASTAGCSGDDKKHSASRSDRTNDAEPIAAVASAPSPARTMETETSTSAAYGPYPAPSLESSTQDSEWIQVPDGSLPPDLVANVSATHVTPGEIVDITVNGSPDVVEVSLADGIGEARLLTYDASENVWRTRYRAPMKFPSERLGLSVTATNGEDHWRRVWLFLEPKQEIAAVDSLLGS